MSVGSAYPSAGKDITIDLTEPITNYDFVYCFISQQGGTGYYVANMNTSGIIKVSSLIYCRNSTGSRDIWVGYHTGIVGGIASPTDTSLKFRVFGANYSCSFNEVYLVKL